MASLRLYGYMENFRSLAGAGKSVLIASVIDGLECSLDDGEVLVFFYCDFRSERSTDAAEVMRSLLSQLLLKLRDIPVDPGDILDDLTRAKGRGGSVLKNVKQLSRLVSSVAKQFARLPLIIIDALDECRDCQNLLDALAVLGQARLRLFTASRPLQIIKDQFAGLPSISLEKMFRWIECQLNTLKRCVTPTDIREALENLPKGLEETYQQILLAIGKEAREAEAARRALTWLVAVYTPLRLAQILEALSIDLDRRVLDTNFAPMHGPALLDALSSLVTHDEETDIVILSHFSVQEYLTGEVAYTKLSAYHIDLQYAEGLLAQSCMCYIATYLDQGQGSGVDVFPSPTSYEGRVNPDYMELSRTSGHHETNQPPPESRPLLEYVLSHAFDHLAHVKPGNTTVLRALVALGADVRRNSSAWERIRMERTSSCADWPTSQDDFVLYILIAFATEPLLRSFLGRGSLKSKPGTNPLVYAAQLDRIPHARTLLSRGASLSRRGLLASCLRQVTPLEAAIRHRSSAVVDLFLTTGNPVPGRIFAGVLKGKYMGDIAGARITARLMQTEDFAEWAVEVQDRFPLLGFLSDLDYTHKNVMNSEAWPKDEDVVSILRRLVQVGCDPFAHSSSAGKLLHQATAAGHVSTLKYMLSLNIPPPPDILLCIPCSAKERFPPSSQTMRLLLDSGADIHATTTVGNTPLHVTLMDSTECNMSEGDCLERVKLLTNAGCNPSTYNLNGDTPLHFATFLGFTTVIQYLLSLRIPRPGNIILAASLVRSRKASMIQYLIRMGANALVVSDNGNTMLHRILNCSDHLSGHQGPEEDCLESTKLLINAGCSPLAVNSVGDTPMDVALQTGHISVVKCFLALNIPLPPDALLRASSVLQTSPNSLQMIKMLAERREYIRVVSPDGDNALHRIVCVFDTEYLVEIVKVLLDAGCDASARNAAGQTPIHNAARIRNHKMIIVYLLSRGVPLPHDIMLVDTTGDLHTFFLDRGADPCVVAKNGDTVLHTILNTASPERDVLHLTKAVIRSGCNPFTLNSAGESSLRIAVRRGYVSVIKHLLSIDLLLPSDILLTASYPRSANRRNSGAQTILFLVEKGAPTGVVTGEGDSALHLALSSTFRVSKGNDTLQVAQALINAGCDPRARNLAGETALHAAAKGGHLAVMEYLVSSHGVPFDPDILLALASSDRPGILKLKVMRSLVDKGADIRVVTPKGDTALHFTLGCGIEVDRRLETAQLLVESGCNPLQSNLVGQVPLHVAASSGFPSLVKYLHSLNAPLPPDILISATAPLGKKHVPLSVLQTFRFLVDEGANVHALASNGDTPLHIVIRQCFTSPRALKNDVPWKIIGFLLNAGCDPFVRNAEGQTAFDLAEAQGHHFYNNFIRLVNTHRGDANLPAIPQPLGSKRRADDMSWAVGDRLVKRGRWDDLVDDDEIAEIDEQLMG
ncbi:ankyrin repeat-containing domain protein [Chiua virens]|nr:ankyrin repeat-containing domain protein [Chiua virens]